MNRLVSVDAYEVNALCSEGHKYMELRDLVSRVRSSVVALEVAIEEQEQDQIQEEASSEPLEVEVTELEDSFQNH